MRFTEKIIKPLCVFLAMTALLCGCAAETSVLAAGNQQTPVRAQTPEPELNFATLVPRPTAAPQPQPGARGTAEYDPARLGVRAEAALGEEAAAFYRETLIPAILSRKRRVNVPEGVQDKLELIIGYYQQNCLLEHLAGTPTLLANRPILVFSYPGARGMTDEQYAAEINKIARAVETALACVREDYTRMEAILALYQYIIRNAVYDDKADDVNAYGIIVGGKGVCYGYARAFQTLLAQLGEDEGYILEWGEPLKLDGHAWNLLEIDGIWYHFDTTWEAGVSYSAGLKYYAMDAGRRDSGVQPGTEYSVAPSALDIAVPRALDSRYSLFGEASGVDVDIENHRVTFYVRRAGDPFPVSYVWDTIAGTIKKE